MMTQAQLEERLLAVETALSEIGTAIYRDPAPRPELAR